MTRDYTHLPIKLEPELEGEAKNDSNPSNRNENDRTQEHVGAAPIHSQEDAVDSEHKAYDANKEPTPMEAIMKFWKILADEENARAFQTILAVLIFLTTAVIALIYAGQLSQMIESNRVARITTVMSQRAYIFARKELQMTQGISATNKNKKSFLFVPILENTGNTAGYGVRVHFNDNTPDFTKLPEEYLFEDRPVTTPGVFPNTPTVPNQVFTFGPHSTVGGGGLAIG